MNDFLTYIGGFIGTAVLLDFSRKILTREIPPTSPMSWGMWSLLDALLTEVSYQAAPHTFGWLLPAGWTLGAASVTITCFLCEGNLAWSWRETLCVVVTIITAYFWFTIGGEGGIIAGAVALTVAGVPLFTDMIRQPNRGLFPVSSGTCVACLYFIAASDRSLIHIFLPASSFVYNFLISLLVLRDKK